MKYFKTLMLVLFFSLTCMTAQADKGTLISKLVILNDNVTDVDSDAVTGLALIGVNTKNGSWYYTLDGLIWRIVEQVSETHALLLAADKKTRLEFQPNLNFNGTINKAIVFRAWDRSSGTAGSSADATHNGGTTAFSRHTESASITVTAINDAPVLDNKADIRLDSVAEDSVAVK